MRCLPCSEHLSFDLFLPAIQWFTAQNIPTYVKTYPIGSMYGIYANIGGLLMVNVTIYSIHGSYGIYIYIIYYKYIMFHNISHGFQAGPSITSCKRGTAAARITSMCKKIRCCGENWGFPPTRIHGCIYVYIYILCEMYDTMIGNN
jgi:hypothetical protein